ncbi:MAG: alpha/beta fold hydrolase [Panacagrimonas sp.]|jgi:polyhydroxyalkanoate depolymerase|nr:alpha/beta fold hydrolase [Panacagrimonas sp.]MCC2657993.1 alpha/beta fold hydrolase [Panacagrimonas sp.]
MTSTTVAERSNLEKALLAFPPYWPIEWTRQIRQRGLRLPLDWMSYVKEAAAITFPDKPGWVTPHTVAFETQTMWLRDFSDADAPSDAIPVIIDAPYAGHPSTIADYADGQSLVQTLKAGGAKRLYVTDWKSASHAMRNFGIDKYLADLRDAVDHVGGRAHLVGLCQGGWLSAMLAARYPGKAVSLVLAGAPIDTHAGSGPVTKLAKRTPLSFYRSMVAMGGGRMRGRFMLQGWKNMHPDEHYWGKYVDLFDNITNPQYVNRARHFASWYEHVVDLPGRLYLEAVKHLFKLNRLARGEFVALGERISLKTITVPLYLLAGADDDITTPEQVFNAENLVGTPRDQIRKELAPGGHIGLFMGAKTLKEQWAHISAWIGQQK